MGCGNRAHMCGTRARAEPSGPGGCECNLVTEATVTICLKPNAAENMLGAALAMLLPALLPDAAHRRPPGRRGRPRCARAPQHPSPPAAQLSSTTGGAQVVAAMTEPRMRP